MQSLESFGSLCAGDMLPRFATAYFKSYVLWFFMVAVVLLAFDLRGRDERASGGCSTPARFRRRVDQRHRIGLDTDQARAKRQVPRLGRLSTRRGTSGSARGGTTSAAWTPAST